MKPVDWCADRLMVMARTSIEINDELLRKARKLTGLQSGREIVDRALRLLVRFGTEGILRYPSSGTWRGHATASRKGRKL